MKMIIQVVAVFILALGLGACGHKEGVENVERRAFLYFTGYTNQAEVSVDGTPFEVGRQMTQNDRYQIQPGVHLVEVRHAGRTLVKRQIYVTDGAAKEIQIPNP
jgi:hypothetical protein